MREKQYAWHATFFGRLGIGVAVFIVFTAFHIFSILSLKRTSEKMADFFQNTEGNLKAA